MWELLVSPAAVLGCVAGVALAALLHLAFPSQDLLFAQTLLVAVCFAGGLALSLRAKGKQ